MHTAAMATAIATSFAVPIRNERLRRFLPDLAAR
jgi:hypothetical protein